MNGTEENANIIITNCPHCKTMIVINPSEVNCAIFRHGVLKETNKQMDPHSTKDVCDYLAKHGKIYGCGKPFKLVRNDSFHWIAEKCEYI